MKIFLWVVAYCLLIGVAAAEDNQEQFQVNSPVMRLYGSQIASLPTVTNTGDVHSCTDVGSGSLASSGELSMTDLDALLDKLNLPKERDAVILLHILRWSD